MREQILRLRVCRNWRGERWIQYTHLQNIRRGGPRGRCRTYEFVGRPEHHMSRAVATAKVLKHVRVMLDEGQLVGGFEVRFYTRRKWSNPRAKKGGRS